MSKPIFVFPCPETYDSYGGRGDGQKGMTLRDWFAGQALAGFLASKSHSTSFNPEDDANYVYCIADAMLLAREKDLAHKPTPE